MSSIKDICIVLRDRLLLDQQSPEGAAAEWEALKTELTHATGLQQAMDTTTCTLDKKAWGKRHAVLKSRNKRIPYNTFRRLEIQVHNRLRCQAAAAGGGGSSADFFVAVPMQTNQSLPDYLMATSRRNDPYHNTIPVHKDAHDVQIPLQADDDDLDAGAVEGDVFDDDNDFEEECGTGSQWADAGLELEGAPDEGVEEQGRRRSTRRSNAPFSLCLQPAALPPPSEKATAPVQRTSTRRKARPNERALEEEEEEEDDDDDEDDEVWQKATRSRAHKGKASSSRSNVHNVGREADEPCAEEGGNWALDTDTQHCH